MKQNVTKRRLAKILFQTLDITFNDIFVFSIRSVNFKRNFWYPQFFQKTIEKIHPNYLDTSGRIVFVRFLEELKTPKRHFEINCPLAGNKNVDCKL